MWLGKNQETSGKVFPIFFSIMINNYSPKWGWLVVDIYRAVKSRGEQNMNIYLSVFGFSCLCFMTFVIISSQKSFQELNFWEFLRSRKRSFSVSYI